VFVDGRPWCVPIYGSFRCPSSHSPPRYADLFITSDPKTPEGVVVGTPRSEIDGTVPGGSADVHAMDWYQGQSAGGIGVGTPTLFQSAERDPLAFHIELPDPSHSQFSFQGNKAPTATHSYLGDATLDHRLYQRLLVRRHLQI
jgi:hypothetical protein